jgi:hypothetical protein
MKCLKIIFYPNLYKQEQLRATCYLNWFHVATKSLHAVASLRWGEVGTNDGQQTENKETSNSVTKEVIVLKSLDLRMSLGIIRYF